MAYETKSLLMSMAQYAVVVKSKKMYDYIAKVANVEGVILEAYDDAAKEDEETNEEQ